MRNIAPPMTMGESMTVSGMGALRSLSGCVGRGNSVVRSGRLRRGGRLKSTLGSSGVGVVTASAAGTGPAVSRLLPTVRSAPCRHTAPGST